jgi:hypothetical protein
LLHYFLVWVDVGGGEIAPPQRHEKLFGFTSPSSDYKPNTVLG